MNDLLNRDPILECLSWDAFKAKKGRGIFPRPFLFISANYVFAPPVTVVTPRRFCAQQPSSDWVQSGRSLP